LPLTANSLNSCIIPMKSLLLLEKTLSRLGLLVRPARGPGLKQSMCDPVDA
jgi:hypothetical protein